MLGAFLVGRVELLGGNAELSRRSPDLVIGDKAVVNVESGVFQAFGHHRPGELLEFEGEIEFLAISRLIFALAALQQQDIPQKIETRWGFVGIAALGSRDCTM